MKKDRNSFFGSTSYNMSTMGNIPNMAMPFMGMPYAYDNSSNTLNTSNLTEIENRISKLERNLNRLEARINKLEGSNFYTKDYDTDNNMYMV